MSSFRQAKCVVKRILGFAVLDWRFSSGGRLAMWNPGLRICDYRLFQRFRTGAAVLFWKSAAGSPSTKNSADVANRSAPPSLPAAVLIPAAKVWHNLVFLMRGETLGVSDLQ